MKTTDNIFFIGFVLLCLVSFKGHAQKQLNDSLQKLRTDVSIAGKTGGAITKDELLNSKGLETSSPNHAVEGFTVDIFIIERDKNGKDLPQSASIFYASGHELTKQMKDEIRNLPNGSQVEFMDIHCFPKYKTWHFVDPFTFTIR
jgi:hypothetical protein